MSESRPDPRKRPPDPAGTQPKVDPESLRASSTSDVPSIGADSELSPAVTADGAFVGNGSLGDATAGEQTAAGTATLAPPASIAVGAPAGQGQPASTAEDMGSGGDVGGNRPVATSGPNPHAPRFQFVFGALGALSVAAVALALALLRGPAAAPERPWSAWKPVASGVDPAQQIAEYVAPQYRLADGKQIVQAVGGPPTLKGQPLTLGIVHSGQTPAPLEGNNVLYQLCGDGADCSIKEGKPSSERGLLVAREALELALYTFRYVSGVDRVIVTMPPPPPGSVIAGSGGSSAGTKGKQKSGSSGAHGKHGSQATASAGATEGTTGSQASSAAGSLTSAAARTPRHALIFSAQDLESQLGKPLNATLSPVTPQVSQMTHWPDTQAVAALTNPRIYDFTVSETQQGLVMLLEPPGLGG